jgi:large subunit ribosomal protein L4
MPEAPVLGGGRAAVPLDDKVFGVRFHEALAHESVRAERAARRRGTASTRTRGMVSGGGTKPWRQKGTGRARAGSIRSPLWTGGGTVFGPQPRSYTFKVNRKERRAALRGALSLHAGRGSLAVIEREVLSEPKTRLAVELLAQWDQQRPTLVVLDNDESATRLSFRNLPGVSVLGHDEVGVTDLLGAASLILSRPALEALTTRAATPEAKRAPTASPAAAPTTGSRSRRATQATAATDAPAAAAPQESSSEGETPAGGTPAAQAQESDAGSDAAKSEAQEDGTPASDAATDAAQVDAEAQEDAAPENGGDA